MFGVSLDPKEAAGAGGHSSVGEGGGRMDAHWDVIKAETGKPECIVADNIVGKDHHHQLVLAVKKFLAVWVVAHL